MYKEVEKMTNSKKMNPQKLKDMLLKYALYIILLLLLVSSLPSSRTSSPSAT